MPAGGGFRLSSLYRTAFEQSRDAMVVLGRDGVHDANTAALHLFDVPDTTSLTGLGIAALSPSDQPDGRPSDEAARDRLEQAYRDGRAVFEWHHETLAGRAFTAEVSLDRLDLDQGPLLKAIVHDLTEHTDGRERLRHLDKAHDFAQRIAEVGHWSYDVGANEVRWSPELFRLFGLEPSDAVLSLESFMARVHPNDRALLQEAIEEAMAGRQSECIHRIVRPDGTVRTVRVIGEVEFAADGRPLYLYGTTQDITEQRQLEENLHRLVAILDSAPQIIGMFDAAGALLYLNAAGRSQVGLPAPTGGAHWAPATGWNQEGLPVETKTLEQTAYTFHPKWAAERILNEGLPVAREHGIWQGETVVKPLDRPEFPAYETIIVHRDAAGAVSQTSIMVRDISEQKAAESEIQRLAYFDPLTALPNRRLVGTQLAEAMAHSRRDKHYGALLFLDVDDFKAINDASGHQAGDRLLVNVAQRAQTSLREGDIISRVGGDEFVVLLENLGDSTQAAADAARRVADKLRAVISFLPATETHSANVTLSVGIYVFDGSEDSSDTLMRNGDQALYGAKRSGRGQVCFFDSALQRIMDEHAQIEADLRHALPNGELALRYQAQVDAAGTVTGAELLLRWLHPDRGSVPPNEFIPMAEETGLIHSTDHWVLQCACAQLAAWSAEPAFRDLKVAVNVSAARFHASDFVDGVKAALERTGAPPGQLELELTETLLLRDAEEAADKMRALKALGVRFAVDDFGTGYSALAYLTSLPFDRIKIDKSFVTALPDSSHDAVLAHTIIKMARSLGLEVISEGVETTAQRDWLIEKGCLAQQGFLFSRPVTQTVFEALYPMSDRGACAVPTRS